MTDLGPDHHPLRTPVLEIKLELVNFLHNETVISYHNRKKRKESDAGPE